MSNLVRLFSAAAVSVSLSISAQFLAYIPPVGLALADKESYLVDVFAYGMFGDVNIPSEMVGSATGFVALLLVLACRRIFRWRPGGRLIAFSGISLSGATLGALWVLCSDGEVGSIVPASNLVAILISLTWFAVPALGAEIVLVVFPLLAKMGRIEVEATPVGRGVAGEIFPIEDPCDRTWT
ncbi:hypothetical protein [Streptomyces sp. NPDC048623]|uniref:hypothetical protein n=1 Tax=Streptomyces sp. NPDC048623 TaxID=3155761 RepID=UPI003426EA4F